MKHKIIKLDKKNYKVFGYTDDKIISSSKNHKNFDSLLSALEKSAFTESIKSIAINSVNELSYNEGTSEFKTVYINEKGKKKKQVFLVDNKEERNLVVADIAAIKGGFKKEVVPESRIISLIRKMFIIVFTSGAFYWLRNVAIKAEAGEHLDVGTGRNRGLLQIIVNLTEAIGATGIIIIYALLLIYIIYLTIKGFTNPPNEVTYS